MHISKYVSQLLWCSWIPRTTLIVFLTTFVVKSSGKLHVITVDQQTELTATSVYDPLSIFFTCSSPSFYFSWTSFCELLPKSLPALQNLVLPSSSQFLPLWLAFYIPSWFSGFRAASITSCSASLVLSNPSLHQRFLLTRAE